jgi:hypothetical protein
MFHFLGSTEITYNGIKEFVDRRPVDDVELGDMELAAREQLNPDMVARRRWAQHCVAPRRRDEGAV